jgi:hypothetical protein
MRGSGFEGCRYRPLLSLNQNGRIRQTGPSSSYSLETLAPSTSRSLQVPNLDSIQYLRDQVSASSLLRQAWNHVLLLSRAHTRAHLVGSAEQFSNPSDTESEP